MAEVEIDPRSVAGRRLETRVRDRGLGSIDEIKAAGWLVDPLKSAQSARQRPDGTRHVHDAEITVVIFISAEIPPADIHGSTWKLACGV